MIDPIVLGAIIFAVLLIVLCTSLWLAISVALVAVIGFFVFKGDPGMTPYVPFNSLNSFTLTAVPLFVLMGEVFVRSGASEMIYKGMSKWFAWLPGGLLHANVASCALFAAISGSSVATAATIGTVAFPALEARGYDSRLNLGTLAGGGTLGILIPPSVTMIIYGMLAEVSIGQLFAGGVIPGILFAIGFMIYVFIRSVKDPKLAPRETGFSLKDSLSGLVDFWPTLTLMAIVLGGIFGGLVTPTEAAALGASAALIIGLVLKKLTWHNFTDSLVRSLETTCMVLFLVASAYIFSALLSMMEVPTGLALIVKNSHVAPWQLLAMLYILYLFLGCFLDVTSCIVMTASAVLPMVSAAGFDLVWFGVILVILVEVGLLTPPMGINLFVIQGISQKPLTQVIAGSWPFFVMELSGVIVFSFFPDLVLWLPTILFRS